MTVSRKIKAQMMKGTGMYLFFWMLSFTITTVSLTAELVSVSEDEFVVGMEDTTVELSPDIMTLLKTAESEVVLMIDELLEEFEEFTDTEDELESEIVEFDEFTVELTDSTEDITDELDEFVEDITDELDEFVEDITDELDEFVEDITDELVDPVEGLDDADELLELEEDGIALHVFPLSLGRKPTGQTITQLVPASVGK
jgi:gas vesicle protein